MKFHILSVVLLVFAIAIAGCASAALTPTLVSASATGEPTVTLPPGTASHGNPIGGHVELVDALRAAGATVEPSEPVTQAFFTPEGNIIKVNGADVQVFEYESAEAMENEASQVAPDGGSIGTTMVTWVDTPHFYKAGRIIALYVGSDQAVLDLLEQVLGPQFAGR
jgi:hypothetical protein